MKKLGVGIIGCGNISEAYLRLAPKFKALEIRKVADLDMDAAKVRAEEFGVKAVSVADLLAAEDIDVVVNLTIPNAHFAVSKLVLEAANTSIRKSLRAVTARGRRTARTGRSQRAARGLGT